MSGRPIASHQHSSWLLVPVETDPMRQLYAFTQQANDNRQPARLLEHTKLQQPTRLTCQPVDYRDILLDQGFPCLLNFLASIVGASSSRQCQVFLPWVAALAGWSYFIILLLLCWLSSVVTFFWARLLRIRFIHGILLR